MTPAGGTANLLPVKVWFKSNNREDRQITNERFLKVGVEGYLGEHTLKSSSFKFISISFSLTGRILVSHVPGKTDKSSCVGNINA